MRHTIAHITTEVAPYFKRGGLGDVMGALPQNLEGDRYHNVMICLYSDGHMSGLEGSVKREYRLSYLGVDYDFTAYHLFENRVDYYFVRLSDNRVLGGDREEEYKPYSSPSNIVPLFYFARAAYHVLKEEVIHPGFVCCHDWQTAGALAYPDLLAAVANGRPPVTLFMIHNYEYQGEIYPDILPFLEPAARQRVREIFTRFGSASMLALGLGNSMHAGTVSRSYALELERLEAPHPGLKYLDLCGRRVLPFLNGIDDSLWRPDKSPFLERQYDAASLENKTELKRTALLRYGFGRPDDTGPPLVLMLCRLTYQKGIGLFVDFDNDLERMAENMAGFLGESRRFLVMGTPADGQNGPVARQLRELERRFEGRFVFVNGYNEAEAHQLLAAADMLVAPSLFEPCGLIQVYAMAFGTVPLVRPVGGMKDTVDGYFDNPAEATGFYIDSYSRESLNRAVARAETVYLDSPGEWRRMMKRGMGRDFSWHKMKQQYFEFFRGALASAGS